MVLLVPMPGVLVFVILFAEIIVALRSRLMPQVVK